MKNTEDKPKSLRETSDDKNNQADTGKSDAKNKGISDKLKKKLEKLKKEDPNIYPIF